MSQVPNCLLAGRQIRADKRRGAATPGEGRIVNCTLNSPPSLILLLPEEELYLDIKLLSLEEERREEGGRKEEGRREGIYTICRALRLLYIRTALATLYSQQ